MTPDEAIDEILRRLPPPRSGPTRFVVAIAGPPAAGKSSFAEALVARLAPRAAVLGLDAFHFDDAILTERDHRARKGAAHTFDAGAYRLILEALRDRPDEELSVPVFDRSTELSRNCARVVEPSQDIVVTEGNYLLIDDEPWASLANLFDLTVSLDAPVPELEARTLRRWAHYGLDDSEGAARWSHNDAPNGEYVRSWSRAADIEVR